MLVFMVSCTNNTAGPFAVTEGNFYDTISTSVEWYVDKDSSLPDKNSVARVIAKGYTWSEVPLMG
ncbi:MAG: hypothetical protein ABI675_17140 [Chitinophagaceae bacterium]